MGNYTDCILDLTDACERGSGRAIDDDICDSFISRETYEVNKNESWQLGYKQGRADAERELKEDTSITLRFLASELMKNQINYSEDTCHYFSKGIQAFVIKLENFIAEQVKE